MASFHPLRAWRPRVAIDVGTAFIRVATDGEGIETLVGAGALLRQGVVADPEGVSALLRPCLDKLNRWGILGPRVLVGVPTDARDEERAALCRALRAAGAAEVELVPEPRAAALGAGVDLSSPYAQMIVDVGEGVTDCAIFRAGRILAARALRIGCADLREQLRRGILETHGVRVDSATAERILIAVGLDDDNTSPATLDFCPSALDAAALLTLARTELVAMLAPVAEKILATIADFLRGLPHEPGCEIIESGILLTGGGAMLPGMARRLSEATAIPVRTAPNPLAAVILGLHAMVAASA
ncbi:rod shape-determining protein [Geoalkalibacter sp.]|uniref:rod shape-determining protein n=1 Tax=Geoalkalibacter sp. TaxID=3041440 RepID=UPI00272DFB03|nr:rod shape-determining protein [Geoalkalibacter sp.]